MVIDNQASMPISKPQMAQSRTVQPAIWTAVAAMNADELEVVEHLIQARRYELKNSQDADVETDITMPTNPFDIYPVGSTITIAEGSGRVVGAWPFVRVVQLENGNTVSVPIGKLHD